MSGFDDFIKRILEKDQEILQDMGDEFYEEEVSYWDKWGKPAHEEIVDKNRPNNIE